VRNYIFDSLSPRTPHEAGFRLGKVEVNTCLAVTSIAFHPRDDRFFLAGSLDSILRLWSIPDKSVAYWAQTPDLITAVAFTPDGKTAMAGVLSGLCLFYETEGLKQQAQIHVRSSRGKNAKGSKVTGIRTMTIPPDDPNGEVKVLITSNDSRVRIYNLKDKSLEIKLRGHENTCSQINASFSDDARYVITGSEDKRCYLWTLGPSDNEKRPLEFFEAHSDIVTAAIIAPTQTRKLLSTSGDPIYDLCNPPPVTLLSREESHRTGSEKRDSGSMSEVNVKKPEESPGYLARSSHHDGSIIVTADYLGCIKVYRCDCAYKKRTRDNWETGSMRKIIRTGSIMTKHSGGSHSRRNSVTQPFYSPHIESWRNGITDDGNGSIRSNTKASRSDRSVSPGKFNHRASMISQSTTNSQTNLANASAARQQPYATVPLIPNATPSVSTTSPPPSIYKATTNNTNYTSPPTPSFTFQSAKEDNLRLDSAGHSNTFWNLATWRNQLAQDPTKLAADSSRLPMDRGASLVSKLSSDEGSVERDGDSENELTCKKCSGKDFRAKKTLRGLVMVCKSCGETVG
jgi:WD40 repeat protein